MTFIDCLALTLFSAAICITLPKMLSLLQMAKANRASQLSQVTQETSVRDYAAQQALSEPVSVS